MLKRSLFAAAIVAASFSVYAQQAPVSAASALGSEQEELRSVVAQSVMPELRWPDFTDYRKHLENFYAPLEYREVWIRNGVPTEQALAVIALLRDADGKGINAADYDAQRWQQRVARLRTAGVTASDRVRFDVALSATLMRYISDLHIGRINPRNVNFDLDIEQKKYYLPKVLNEVRESRDVRAALAGIEPPYEGYRRLAGALQSYVKIAAAGDQPPLKRVKLLAPGDRYEDLAALATFLKRVGDLPQNVPFDAKKLVYEGALVDAVKKFQRRHGLVADGKISDKTFAQLDVPLSRRVQQLRWAMERWRWAPTEFDRPPIVVNIPEFRLRALDEQQQSALTMNVVVGKAFEHETPVFQGSMTYLVFRPYWNVTPNIQRKELGPKVAADPGYLRRNDYEVVDENGQVVTQIDSNTIAAIKSVRYSVRQKPGPLNALGAVKFMFPNRNNVYLHSTPAQDLFSRSRRDFSHGCIRVEDPLALATWVLRDDPSWSREKIAAAMSGKDEDVHVRLTKAIPILIVYATAVVDADGQVHFFEDIYGHDATLENALAQGYPYPA